MACGSKKGVYIPECYGGIYGKSDCTCADKKRLHTTTNDPHDPFIVLERRIAKLESRLDKIEKLKFGRE